MQFPCGHAPLRGGQRLAELLDILGQGVSVSTGVAELVRRTVVSRLAKQVPADGQNKSSPTASPGQGDASSAAGSCAATWGAGGSWVLEG